MDISSLIIIIIASIFGYLYINENKEGNDAFIYVILKDIWFILCITFIFAALSSNTVPISTTSLTYTYSNQTVNTTSSTIYGQPASLAGLDSGYSYVYYALFLLYLVKLVFDVWDNLFNKKKAKK